MQGVQFRSLTGELESHMSCGKKQNIKQKYYCNKLNKDFENGLYKKNLKKKKKLIEKSNWGFQPRIPK